MNLRTSRNLLIALGAYYTSRWLVAVLAWLLAAVAHSVRTPDYATQSAMRSLVNGAPDAIAAAFCGITVTLLADSPTPARWTVVPAALLVLDSFERAQAVATTWTDFMTQALIGILPAIVCIAAGRMTTRHRV